MNSPRQAVIVFLYRDGQVLLGLFRYPNKVIWNGISGYVHEGENKFEAAAREVKEKIGVDVEIDDLEIVGEVHLHTPFVVFVVTAWRDTIMAQEEGILELWWHDISNIPWDTMHEGNKLWLKPILEKYQQSKSK